MVMQIPFGFISFITSLTIAYFQLIWKRVKKSGFQVLYEKDHGFNALVRRISALPFTKHEDLDKAFAVFKARANLSLNRGNFAMN